LSRLPIKESGGIFTWGFEGLKYLLMLKKYGFESNEIEYPQGYWYIGGQHGVGFAEVRFGYNFIVFPPPPQLPILNAIVASFQTFTRDTINEAYNRNALLEYAAAYQGVNNDPESYSVFSQWIELTGCYATASSNLPEATMPFQSLFFNYSLYGNFGLCNPDFIDSSSHSYSPTFLAGIEEFYQLVEQGIFPSDSVETYRGFAQRHLSQSPLNSGNGYSWNLVWDYYPPPAEAVEGFLFPSNNLSTTGYPRTAADSIITFDFAENSIFCDGQGVNMMFMEYVFPNTVTVESTKFITVEDLPGSEVFLFNSFTNQAELDEMKNKYGKCSECFCEGGI